MDMKRLLWACVQHDYALHEVNKATVLARRLATDLEDQQDLRELQLTIVDELDRRKIEDRDDQSAS